MTVSFPNRSVPFRRRLGPRFALALAALALVAASAVAQRVDPATRTITVEPSGGDDTAAVQAALDACVTFGPGCTVHLTEGTFHTQQLVAREFRGTFRGAGQDATVLQPFERFTVSSDEVAVARPPTPENPWPFHVVFIGGDVTVSDLTLRMTGEEPAHPWTLFGLEWTVMAASLTITGEETEATVERVTVEGGPGGFEGVNLINGIYTEGFLPPSDDPDPTVYATPLPMRGTFVIRDSTFRSLGWGTPLFNLTDAQVLIENNRYEGTFSGGDAQDVGRSTVVVRDNVLEDVAIGFEVIQGGQSAPSGPSTFVVHGNEFDGVSAVAVRLSDLENERTIGAVVDGNTFRLDGDAVAVTGSHADGVVVRGNVVRGDGRAFVEIGVAPDEDSAPTPAVGWVIAGNDAAGLSVTDALVTLGSGSDGTIVVCDGAGTVSDEGVANVVACGD
jgi:hypothetical protein